MTKRLGKARWAAMRMLLGSAGRLSEGIRIGFRYGFDSGSMLDYVYVNKARGSLGVGRLIDRVYLNAIGWRAIRARRELLKDVLRKEVAERGGEVFILDVASGPGRYLQDLVEEYAPGSVRVECRDLDRAGLAEGEDLARVRGLKGLSYVYGDALDPQPASRAPEVIVVSGLYELLLDDEVIAASVSRLRSLLAPGGVLVFTTQTRHPQLEFIANVLPNRDGVLWEMKCRPVELAERWAVDAGFTTVASRREQVGLFTVTTATTAVREQR
ncbi:class I SAM-dependent methyltransferase family protein [Streptomyces albipurpureus]|uniref:Class I SAM-dependent methyltransferase family protein n=1 Tax=Streptomyces albipurpureus TaxID=2897419 RepID=A0ABT0UUG3_9ACTN|nr:class I SAM-dependent methyltransferase family protein [Streptomyces sp. CWNU-1]MCM2392084.1 class I SAM-dependent methyltransferase family protein [Streptomyces sp. CWNU-1]